MLELPEIETLRRGIERDVVGKRVKTVEVSSKAVVSRHPSVKDFKERLEGAKIASVRRTGLLLVLGLDTEELLVIDIVANGRLWRAATKDAVTDDTQIVISFTQAGQLRLIDDHGEAEMFVTSPEGLREAHPELDDLGSDLLEHAVSWTDFAVKLRSRTETLHELLTDPTFIVGLGDLYADEILHSALLMYSRTPDSLSAQEIRRLYRAIVQTLHDAVKYRGTWLEGHEFYDLHGEKGEFTEYLNVHGRAGDRASNGRGVVQRKKVKGRYHYFTDYQV